MVLLRVTSDFSESRDFSTPEIYAQVPEVGICHHPLRLLCSVSATLSYLVVERAGVALLILAHLSIVEARLVTLSQRP